MTILHTPVLLNAVMEGLQIRPEGYYVDATYGRGGHSQHILQQLSSEGHLWVMDRDPEAIAHAREHLNDVRVTVWPSSFSDIDIMLQDTLVDAVLFDLGVASTQLDTVERGFSFRGKALLDMRFDPGSGEAVHVWLNKASYEDIADVLHYYGQEPLARVIARAIVQKRQQQPLLYTTDLAELVAGVAQAHYGPSKIHPATRTFQALRIHVNDELGHIEKALLKTAALLKKGGRLVCLTFQGLETKMLKALGRGNILLEGGEKSSTVFKKVAQSAASVWEIRNNPRARSAQLTILEKVS